MPSCDANLKREMVSIAGGRRSKGNPPALSPVTLLTPKQAEQVQLEFKRLAHEAGIKGARINVQRVVADDYEKVISEAKACLRTAMPKAA